MSDEQGQSELSKRERQKLRREQKRRQQVAEARKARRSRLAIMGLVVALVLAGSGYALAGWLSQRAEERELRAQAAERLDELGCTELERMPHEGAGHLTGESLAQFPPDEIYPDRPATSGLHLPNWIISGVYDKVIDERLLVHNLEHGYVNTYYTEDADPDEVTDLEEFARERIDGAAPKMIVAPWPGELPGQANFAMVAWDHRQLCEHFDRGVLLTVLDEHHGLRGQAPEKEAPPHLRAPDEGIDPDASEGDLLFPPLGEQTGDGPTMEEDAQPADG